MKCSTWGYAVIGRGIVTTVATGVTVGVVVIAAWAMAGVDDTNASVAQSATMTPTLAVSPRGEHPAPRRTAGAAQRVADRTQQRLRRVFDIETRDAVFFITVDDGFTKDPRALAFVRRHRIPVTVFLTNAAIGGQATFFRDIAAYGGSVENHTMTHASFPTQSHDQLEYEVCGPQGRYAQKFQHKPTMLRPPYGEGGYSSPTSEVRKRIDRTATSCGLNTLVMWNAVAEHGTFTFLRGSLHRGDIVLFHFTDHLANELAKVMKMARRKGLRPASLQEYVK